ncbi:MAG: biliverdin-producing heme oxygenase [Aquabacterium sp.]
MNEQVIEHDVPSRPPRDESVLAALRASTRPLHDRIEALLALDGAMPLQRYRAIIAGFHGFLVRWEQEIGAALPARLHGWFAARGRARFAQADLAYLNDMGDTVPMSPAPSVAAAGGLPDDSLASVFGSLYVIEGSALGGQVIVPRLARDMGLVPGQGASYFHGHGERTGAMWLDFRQRAVAEIGADPARRHAACHAAGQTFSALIATFEPLLA